MDGEVEYDPEWSTVHLVINTLLSATFAGLVAVLVTAAIERWGGTFGGILGTVPGTIVPTTVGLSVQADTNYARLNRALYVIPLGMTSAVFFLFLWRLIPPYLPNWPFRRRLIAMICLSLFGWLCWSVVLLLLLEGLQRVGFTIPQIGVTTAILLFCMGLVGACYKPLASPKGSKKVPPLMYLARSVIAASAIGFAVLISKWSDLLAGIFACFPAIFLTTMVSLWISQGESTPTGAVGPMMLGSGAVYVYAIVYALIFPYFNDRLLLGFAVALTAASSWIISVAGLSVPIYFGLQWRNSYGSHDGELTMSPLPLTEEDKVETEVDDDEEVSLKSQRERFTDSSSHYATYGAIKE